jgi:3-isopropylmalate/(R)-2-methylmalate dehydratase small subunit
MAPFIPPFTRLAAVAVPLDLANVDTDQIIPARYLGRTRAEQVEGMYHDLALDAQGRPRSDFPLNQPAFADARILVADRNFGCGSSRENAVTVMVDRGFQVFIAPSFGDIFFNNCLQNGVLPIRLPADRVEALRAALRAAPGPRSRSTCQPRRCAAQTAASTASTSIRSARTACCRASTRSR